jgi:hypothetical protein
MKCLTSVYINVANSNFYSQSADWQQLNSPTDYLVERLEYQFDGSILIATARFGNIFGKHNIVLSKFTDGGIMI